MHLEIFHMANATERGLEYHRAERWAPHLDRLAAERRRARVRLLERLNGRWWMLRAILTLRPGVRTAGARHG